MRMDFSAGVFALMAIQEPLAASALLEAFKLEKGRQGSETHATSCMSRSP